MNKKQKLAIIILSIFIIGMCIGAADAAKHSVKKGKYKVKLTKKEYKKLTATKTKYKTVEKIRNVTKYKTVTKTGQIKKNNTYVLKDRLVESIYCDNFTVYDNKTNQYVKKEITRVRKERDSPDSNGYIATGKKRTEYYDPPHYDRWTVRGTEYGDLTFYNLVGQVFQNYTKVTYYYEEGNYTVKEPYTVQEKYQAKVPYKVRKKATITKNIPKKYRYYWKYKNVYKTVKVPYKIGKWKYVAKSYGIGGIQDVLQVKAMNKRVAKLKAQGWHINWKKEKTTGPLGDTSHYFYCTKTIYKKEKKYVGDKKVKKIKTPLKMTISSYKGLKKGKVFVDIWSGAGLEGGGYAKIK